MTFLKNKLKRSISCVVTIIGISILSSDAAAELQWCGNQTLHSIGIVNWGNTPVDVIAVYRIAPTTWKTEGWWKVRPGAINEIEISAGNRSVFGSYYLSFVMSNNKGEFGYTSNMKIKGYKSSEHIKNVDKKFCVRKYGQVTERISSRSDLGNCPPDYVLRDFWLEVLVPLKGNSFCRGSSEVYIYPDKSDIVEVIQPETYDFLLTNDCKHPVKFAIRYEDIRGNWQTDGWWNFKAGQSSYFMSNGIRLKTKNDKWYIYAETTGKTSLRWFGKHNYSYDGRTLPMQERVDKNRKHQLTINCPNPAKKKGPAKPKSKKNVADRHESGGSRYPPLDTQKLTHFMPEGDYSLRSSLKKNKFLELVGRLNRNGHKRLECVYGPSRTRIKGYTTQYFWYKKVPLLEHEFSLLPDYPSWHNIGRKALDKCPSNGNEAELIRKKNNAAWKQ